MAGIPQPPANISLHTYADDSTVASSGPIIDPICKDLNRYLAVLCEWFNDRNLFISPAKSTATVFTTASNEVNYQLPIDIGGERVPTVRYPKLLGVHFDGLLTFNKHAEEIKKKLDSRNNVLKAITGTDWGKEKETIINTYKAIGQPHLNYGCPIWTPSLSKESWKGLQAAQNTALRIATGSYKMANTDHLQAESKMMPVKDHCEMLSKQFLLTTQLPNHPNKESLDPPTTGRPMRRTLPLDYGDEIKALLPENFDHDTRKTLLKTIHTNSVRESINNMGHNKVLNRPPPPINDSERTLDRKTRTTLSQLRSGYSNYLNSYKARIDPQIQDICPHCQTHSHTTNHVFNCTRNPTDLTVEDLWKKPTDSARFLGLINDDNDDTR